MSLLGIPQAPGAGRARYARAMALYASGALSPAQLEAYRVAAAQDGAPDQTFADRGLTMPQDPTPPDPILTAVDEADRYLATLQGPGIAEVRAGIAAHRAAPLPQQPQSHPVVDTHLAPALESLHKTHPALAQALGAVAPLLHWHPYDRYPAETFGADFLHGNAYAILIGKGGPIPAPDFHLGVFVIAPHVVYRDHNHPAPELYAPLTGPHGWRFGPEAPLVIKPAHQPVWNPPLHPHLIKIGPTPYLCLYGWTRDTDKPAVVIPADDWPALETLRLKGTPHDLL